MTSSLRLVTPTLTEVTARPPSTEVPAHSILDYFAGDCLSLYQHDARALEKAFGWSARTSMEVVKVRSCPAETLRLVACSALRERFGDRAVWPAGFFVEPFDAEDEGEDGYCEYFGPPPSDVLRFNAPARGLLVPVRRVVTRGIQFYRYPKDPSPRWISSAGKAGGSAQTASLHVIGRAVGIRERAAFLLSDTLRAWAVGFKFGRCAIGYNNASLNSIAAQLYEALPSLQTVVVALPDPSPQLLEAMRDAGLVVKLWTGGELV